MFFIKKFLKDNENEWETFVKQAANGTIYHTRQFLNHHKDKFIDESIMIYHNDILVCVLPCCQDGELYFSHKGSTYGGPIFSSKLFYKVEKMKEIIEQILAYYNHNIQFRIANSIYHYESDSLLLYLLQQHLNLHLELSWFIQKEDNLIEKIQNKRNKERYLKFIQNKNIQCISSHSTNDNYILFYSLLSFNLLKKFNTKPTHDTLENFLFFKDSIPKHHSLYIVCDDSTIYGGVFVVKVTNKCWYTFYITHNDSIKNNPSIFYIMNNIQEDARRENVKYIDYGLTTENQGKCLNMGLSKFKQESLCGTPSYRYLFFLKNKINPIIENGTVTATNELIKYNGKRG